jgi:hypothetical protein
MGDSNTSLKLLAISGSASISNPLFASRLIDRYILFCKTLEESISFCVVTINFDSSPDITHIFGVIEFYKRAAVMNFA